ncbi:hypothetical protein BDP27DRAFT_1402931 [Rhodocollybia butyracea]|uniref:Uncharacterized protein n=1 Tax=Rhodocollybia butyracea TaxID=206335 RepID=A0A9P5U8K4_9AGAR|nr:hypothetical protein BDP27DRAFT_1402931 [Rhodocollybia butyracea]
MQSTTVCPASKLGTKKFPTTATALSIKQNFIGIRFALDEKKGTDLVANFAKCKDPNKPTEYHKISIICGFRPETYTRIGLLTRMTGCRHPMCSPGGTEEVLALDTQIEAANEFASWFRFGQDKRTAWLIRTNSVKPLQQILGQNTAMSAPVLVAHTQTNTIVQTSASAPVHHPTNTATPRRRRVFVGVVLPATVNGRLKRPAEDAEMDQRLKRVKVELENEVICSEDRGEGSSKQKARGCVDTGKR